MYKRKPEEREVILITTDADKEWEVYTASRTWYSKFLKQGWEVIKENKYPDGSFMDATLRVRVVLSPLLKTKDKQG